MDSGASPTVRNNMHACPRGYVLVGARFDTNTFLCAELPFCQEPGHCPGGGCELRANPYRNAGMCRTAGVLVLKSDPDCSGETVGLISDRPGTVVNLQSQSSYENDEAESLDFWTYRRGALVRVYDDPSGATDDDWAEIVYKSAGSPCHGSFEQSGQYGSLVYQYHDFGEDLDDNVSRVEVQSALLDFEGRCLDVNQTDNSVQVYDCHAGRNQAWTYHNTGQIVGLGGRCLEANSAEINNWPFLASPQHRRAAVRVATCNGSVFQKWSVAQDRQVRMFADMCLDIRGGDSFNGAAVQLYPCNGGGNQLWDNNF